MEIVVKGRFLSSEVQSIKMNDGEHRMIKLVLYVDGETVDFYIVDTNSDFDLAFGYSFGDDLSIRCKLAKLVSGNAYKLKFVSFD